jgi:hypothetical protein
MSKRILFVGFAAALSWSIAVVAQEQAPAPSFKEGDSWQFNITHTNSVASTPVEAGDGDEAIRNARSVLEQQQQSTAKE